jgi:hypothetical protein
MTTIADLKASLASPNPPSELSRPLRALWHDARGDWDKAHQIAQDIDGPDGAWIHAYLHRKEGDVSNAAYWYRRAQKPVVDSSLSAEWEQIVTALLNRD